jgi:hypothetical protein
LAETPTCGNTLLPAPELLELEELPLVAPELEPEATVPPEELELLELPLDVAPELEPDTGAAPDELELLEVPLGAVLGVALTWMAKPGSVAVFVPSVAAITMFG